ncbi:MAG: hypothetical protein Kow002_07380 [Anaerolineales bacterium]
MKRKRLCCDPDVTLKTVLIAPLLDLYFKKTGRIFGCQSNNHTQCYGALWTCARCGKRICWEEGTTDLPELCDDCWVDVKIQGASWEDHFSM